VKQVRGENILICKSILIIDDDEGIRETLRLVLELYVNPVFVAGEGQSGLDILKTVPLPCLILLDLMMPIMNGWEFLVRLQKSQWANDTAVIVLTAFLDQTRKNPVTAQAVLQKPIDLTALLAIVQQYTIGFDPKKASSLA
jgi:CheY-like chemotaxis protein